MPSSHLAVGRIAWAASLSRSGFVSEEAALAVALTKACEDLERQHTLYDPSSS
ncbi:hypothetical protein [Aeromicrobium sp. 9AM]|uniref:hypothetical protein n=1 Tax=Aeromicrobium sp. 9AM TaxID=2653126 RepID=UPI0012F1C09C|nr:hypothetical protein [Aeromicrobium sp. 9AM]VXB60539.1 hypothetical protein AERO9AM_20430 [Aeromicrobium sp. 9AM]